MEYLSSSISYQDFSHEIRVGIIATIKYVQNNTKRTCPNSSQCVLFAGLVVAFSDQEPIGLIIEILIGKDFVDYATKKSYFGVSNGNHHILWNDSNPFSYS